MPTVSSAAIARASRSVWAMPWNFKAIRKFSMIVYQGNSVLSWNTKDTSRGNGSPRTGLPSTLTSPCVGATSPPTMLRSVLLPHPDGPKRHTNSPRRMSSDTLSSARTDCGELMSPKRWLTLRIEIASGLSAAPCEWAARTWLSTSVRSFLEFHGRETSVVKVLGLRHLPENAEFLERHANDLECLRRKRAVVGQHLDLFVIDPVDDLFAQPHRLGDRLDRRRAIVAHEGRDLEPGAQHPQHQGRILLTHGVCREYDVSVEVRHRVAERHQHAADALLLKLQALFGGGHARVELARFHRSEPRAHLAERHDVDAVVTPALVHRKAPR